MTEKNISSLKNIEDKILTLVFYMIYIPVIIFIGGLVFIVPICALYWSLFLLDMFIIGKIFFVFLSLIAVLLSIVIGIRIILGED